MRKRSGHAFLRQGLGRLGLALVLALALPARADQSPPEDPAALDAALAWQLGYAAHLQGDFHTAIALFRRSIALRPSPEAHTYLGWSLSHLGRLEEAIAECETAIRLDPDFGNPYNDIGVYLIALGRADESIPWFEKAMRAPRYCCYQFPHFNLGRVMLAKGRLAEARRLFERALDFDPDYEPARRALEAISAAGLRDL
ncbi:MAG: tetratricopeptide repeat protein [Burkholderiales bacterium]|nr:tetratricopeptide repeat protein [Burkholderiales bacterium]